MIEHSAGGRIVTGSANARNQETARNVESILATARVPCDVSSEMLLALWKKLAWNSPFCALSCLLRMTIGEILARSPSKNLLSAALKRLETPAQCRGVGLSPSTAQEVLSFSRGLKNFKPSMLQDLEAGKPLEYEALNGIVIKILYQAGKRAPINEIFYSALKYIDQELRAKQSKGPV